MKNPTKIFISYAKEDEGFKNKLLEHLSSLKLEGLIEPWEKNMIEAGEVWQTSLIESLNESEIILLLVSSDALASSFIYDDEIKKVFDNRNGDTTLLVPILIRPCDWTVLEDFNIKVLPNNLKAISSWGNEDEAFLHVVNELRSIIKHKDKILLGEYDQEKEGEEEEPQSTNSVMRGLHFGLIIIFLLCFFRYGSTFSGLTSPDAAIENTKLIGEVIIGLWLIVVVLFTIKNSGKESSGKSSLPINLSNLFSNIYFLSVFNFMLFSITIYLCYQITNYRVVTFSTNYKNDLTILEDFGAIKADKVYGRLKRGENLKTKLKIGDHDIIYFDQKNDEFEDVDSINVPPFWKEIPIQRLDFD